MTTLIETSAPGKVILHGEHAVVFGKNAIAMSVGLRTKIRVSHDPLSKQVRLFYQNLVPETVWSLEKLKEINFDLIASEEDNDVICFDHKCISCLNILIDEHEAKLDCQGKDAIRATFFLYFSLIKIAKLNELIGLDIVCNSELPIGAGMGSSAAFSVSLAAGLIQAILKPNKVNPELISRWAFESEKLFHGKPSGIDNSICTFGGAILYQNGQIKDRLDQIEFLPILLVYTNVKRNTKLLVEKTSNRRQVFPKIIGHVMDSIDNISLEEWDILKKKPDDNKSKLLIEINQHLLQTIGAGHFEIDRVLNTASEYGFTGKLTGAGGGGTVFVALDRDVNQVVVTKLKESLERKNFKCWQINVGGSGVDVNVHKI